MTIDWTKGLAVGILSAIIFLVLACFLKKHCDIDVGGWWFALGIFTGNFVLHAFVFPLLKSIEF